MSESNEELSRIEVVVLGRLSGQKSPPSETDIAKTLAELVMPAASRGEWQSRLTPILAELRDRSLIDEARRLTETGRQALARALGLSKAPSWKDIAAKHLPALALGLESAAEVATAEQLQAALLAAYLGVERRRSPSQVFAELIASEIGLPRGPVTLNRIRDHLIARRTGIEVRGKTDQVAARMASRSVRAPNSKQLRPALVKRWINQEPIAPAGRSESPPVIESTASLPAATSAPSLDNGSLAAIVTDAARGMGPDGRFGPHKVFISAIWRKLADDLSRRGMNIEDLKKRLVEASKAGLLSLARADTMGAMDPREVKESEIQDRGARFHFVVDGSRPS